MKNQKILIIGAGLTGLALALQLKQFGFKPIVFEKRSKDHLGNDARSVNITLSNRGLQTLQKIGVADMVKEIAVPVTGRTYHLNGSTNFMPYTNLPGYCLHSIKRGDLEQILQQQAEDAGIEVKFDHELQAINSYSKNCFFGNDGAKVQFSYDILFGTDGLNSNVRTSLHAESKISTHSFVYKKIKIEKNSSCNFNKNTVNLLNETGGLLLTLPNIDESASGLLHIKNEVVDQIYQKPDYLTTLFPMLSEKVEGFSDQFFNSPDGAFRSVSCERWFFRNSILFLGDAAHAMVPFYGQGANAGLEDASLMACLIEKTNGDFKKSASLFCETRPPQVEAMSALSLQNLNNLEVQKSDFELFITQKTLELALEENYPNFRSEYFNIAFTSMPFDEALRISNQNKPILTHFARRMKGQNSFTTNDLQKVYQRLNLKK